MNTLNGKVPDTFAVRSGERVRLRLINATNARIFGLAGLHKRLAYWGVKIVTLADGEVGKLHVGLKGIIASIYLDDLTQKTHIQQYRPS